jgi:hypothetical protein
MENEPCPDVNEAVLEWARLHSVEAREYSVDTLLNAQSLVPPPMLPQWRKVPFVISITPTKGGAETAIKELRRQGATIKSGDGEYTAFFEYESDVVLGIPERLLVEFVDFALSIFETTVISHDDARWVMYIMTSGEIIWGSVDPPGPSASSASASR